MYNFIENEKEFYLEFRNQLYTKLKSELNASVWVYVKDDEVIIKITRLGFRFCKQYDHIADNAMLGKSVQEYVDEIISDYRRKLNKTFFYGGNNGKNKR